MCGIAGIFSPDSKYLNESIMQKMVGALIHRGPDSTGIWLDRKSNIALGHQRLAILDLTSAGHQPMTSRCGRYVISFNGEIYNHLALRKNLEEKYPVQWKGHSDTETLLEAISRWGIETVLQRSVGMFAIALWNKQMNKLYLARDRIGEKPLYYGWSGNSFLFASELKAIKQFPGFNNKIDRNVLTLYFRFGYVPTPYSIYQEIFKLEPGCLLEIDLEGVSSPFDNVPVTPVSKPGITLIRWWSLGNLLERDQSEIIRSERVALDQLEFRLQESIELQSIADVPLGAFLSGGIDSSLIVALMQTQNKIPVKTFTIGFKEQGYDETQFANAIAKHLNTDHTDFYVTADEARAVIPQLPKLYDEPFADSSQIPTFLLSQLTRQHVTVALSGDGGDELFGGYNRYSWIPRLWNRLSKLSGSKRRLFLRMLIGLTHLPGINSGLLNKVLPARWHLSLPAEKIHKLYQSLEYAKSEYEFFFNVISLWHEPEQIVNNGYEPAILINTLTDWPNLDEFEHQMMYLDTMTYLPDDILCKVDRAAMGVSLETRIPFLDHKVLELAWQLPLNMKIRNGQGKWILRNLLNKYVPEVFIERPKQGFAIPLGQWLRGALREWVEKLLDSDKLYEEGYLDPIVIQKKWQEHLNGKRNWEHQLWSVLMFQSWLETHKN